MITVGVLVKMTWTLLHGSMSGKHLFITSLKTVSKLEGKVIDSHCLPPCTPSSVCRRRIFGMAMVD